jgi:hypothetical protein
MLRDDLVTVFSCDRLVLFLCFVVCCVVLRCVILYYIIMNRIKCAYALSHYYYEILIILSLSLQLRLVHQFRRIETVVYKFEEKQTKKMHNCL